MEQEKIIDKETSYSVSISGGKVEALRINENLKTVIRVYDEGKIGIAGRIGDGDDKKLLKEAKEKLSQNIAYPCNLSENVNKEVDDVKPIIPADGYVKAIKSLMAKLNAAYPDFIFSNKINMGVGETVYENSKNTRLAYRGSEIGGALVIKEKSSANIMDLSYGFDCNCFDEDKIISDIGKLLNVYNKKVDMPKGDVPVIISAMDVLQYGVQHLIAELYVTGSSLLNGKLGEKVFDEKVNILTDRTPHRRPGLCFFDSEGVINPDYKFHFVKDGVFSGLATYKRSAANFNLPLSGGGYAPFDEVPSVSGIGFKVERTDSLENLVKGKAIFVYVTSGGDMTPDGTVGLPVQVAYLYDNGKLVGRLPEFGINGNLFDFLGKDFIGVARNDIFDFCEDDVLVAKFNVNNVK
ncbi:MAG: metallopeptidase TldD-related protein [Roseburia sp.]|nr:metallopeptidase TldD-related protein [Roseburia sp.]